MKLRTKLIILFLAISVIPMLFMASLDTTVGSIVGLFVILLVVVIAILTAKSISDPIRELTRLADDISKGNLEAKLPTESGNKEIDDLALSVQRMQAALKVILHELNYKKSRTENND